MHANTRIRAIGPNGTWHDDDRGYADIPVTAPLTELEIAQQFPTLGIVLGDYRPHVKGKIREYLPLQGKTVHQHAHQPATTPERT